MTTRGPGSALIILLMLLAVPWTFPAGAEMLVESWETLPTARADFAALEIEGLIYIFGGTAYGEPSPILVYDPIWETLRETGTDLQLTGAIADLSVVWTGTKVLIFGGTPQGQRIREYDPWQDTIVTKATTIPGGPRDATAVWDGDEAWIMGGWTSTGVTNAVHRYDPVADSRTTAPMPLGIAVHKHTAFFDGKLIYVLGGATCPSCGAATTSGWTFDPTTGARAYLGPIVKGNLEEMASFYAHPYAFILGGTNTHYTGGPLDIWRFSPSTGAWDEMDADLPRVLAAPAVAWDGKQAVIFGGKGPYVGSLPTDGILHYRLVPPQPYLEAFAGPGAATVTLTWDPFRRGYQGPGAEDVPIVWYQLTRTTSEGSTTFNFTGETTQYRDVGVPEGEVSYDLTAYGPLYSSRSWEVFVDVVGPPKPPRNFVGAATGSTTVWVQWDPPEEAYGNGRATHYRIFKSASETELGRVIGTTTQETFKDDSREPGVWYYRATAHNAAGESARSDTARIPVVGQPGQTPQYKSCPTRGLDGQWMCTRGSSSPVAAVVAGGTHTCVRLQDGRVDCWGDNGRGQSEDVRTPTTGYLFAAHSNTCAAAYFGPVTCYGDDAWGKTDLGSSPITTVAIGGTHICMIPGDSADVRCSGSNAYGQAPYIRYANARTLAAGERHTCAITWDANVDCFGDDRHGQSTGYTGGDAELIVAGGRYTCISTQGDTLACWGQIAAPPTDLASGIAQLSGGARHACALLDDGSARCWGDNSDGQTTTDGATNIIGIATGSYHTCFLRATRTVDCVGARLSIHDHGQTQPYPGGQTL